MLFFTSFLDHFHKAGISVVLFMVFAIAFAQSQTSDPSHAQGSCTAPYHVQTTDGRYVWSCSEGGTPDNVSNECVCQDGYE